MLQVEQLIDFNAAILRYNTVAIFLLNDIGDTNQVIWSDQFFFCCKHIRYVL